MIAAVIYGRRLICKKEKLRNSCGILIVHIGYTYIMIFKKTAPEKLAPQIELYFRILKKQLVSCLRISIAAQYRAQERRRQESRVQVIVLPHHQFVQFRSVLLFPIEQPEFQRSHVIALAFALNQTIICEAIQVSFPDLPCQFCVLFGIRLLSEDFRRLIATLRA